MSLKEMPESTAKRKRTMVDMHPKTPSNNDSDDDDDDDDEG